MIWTPDLVEDCLREATRTLRLSPSFDTRYLAAKGSWWPEYLQDTTEAYGYTAAVVKPAKPNAAEIGRLDHMIGYFARFMAPDQLAEGMPADTGRVVWARANGLAWPRISQARVAFWRVSRAELDRSGGKSPIPGGNSEPSLRLIYTTGLGFLAQQLNQHAIPTFEGI